MLICVLLGLIFNLVSCPYFPLYVCWWLVQVSISVPVGAVSFSASPDFLCLSDCVVLIFVCCFASHYFCPLILVSVRSVFAMKLSMEASEILSSSFSCFEEASSASVVASLASFSQLLLLPWSSCIISPTLSFHGSMLHVVVDCVSVG